MSMPGQYDDTMGKAASYSPNPDKGVSTPFKPVPLHYQQQDTAYRDGGPQRAPKPTFPNNNNGGFRAWAKELLSDRRVVLVLVVLVLILLLIIIVPAVLLLTMSTDKDSQGFDSAPLGNVITPNITNVTTSTPDVTYEETTSSLLTTETSAPVTTAHCEFNCIGNETCAELLKYMEENECDQIKSNCDEFVMTCISGEKTASTLEITTTSTVLTTTTSSTTTPLNTTLTTESLTTVQPTTPKKPIWAPKPPPVANCSGFDFLCLNNEKVGQLKVCDGQKDCSDGSDESDCSECRTSFYCPMEEGASADGLKKCLRGKVLCDKTRDCPTLLDETFYCRKECRRGVEYKCSNADICIPIGWMCDGDPQCPEEDDEDFCSSPEFCNNGARFCPADRRCIPTWAWCDGMAHCSDGVDEEDCNCNFCSGKDTVLCKRPSGRCIRKAQLCDGFKDCKDGEDEINCPGWCEPEEEVEKVQCMDGKEYPKRWACSGVVGPCRSVCEECDPELAFSCASVKLCIPRRHVCDGEPQCSDGSDEASELCSCSVEANGLQPFRCSRSTEIIRKLKCIPSHRRCDGYRDCPQSEDELDCDDCSTESAFYCATDRSCFPSSSRCDGEVNCPDYSDEEHCTCAECTNQLYQTFLCKANSRCLKKDYVCNQESVYHCPGSVPEDEQFCQPQFDPLNP